MPERSFQHVDFAFTCFPCVKAEPVIYIRHRASGMPIRRLNAVLALCHWQTVPLGVFV